MEGFRRHEDKIKFVPVANEEGAAFMATAYSKCTGKIGVCLATSGPGGIHLLNGPYDATAYVFGLRQRNGRLRVLR
jgi:pyruvate dehydrogenase (quinone)